MACSNCNCVTQIPFTTTCPGGCIRITTAGVVCSTCGCSGSLSAGTAGCGCHRCCCVIADTSCGCNNCNNCGNCNNCANCANCTNCANCGSSHCHNGNSCGCSC